LSPLLNLSNGVVKILEISLATAFFAATFFTKANTSTHMFHLGICMPLNNKKLMVVLFLSGIQIINQ